MNSLKIAFMTFFDIDEHNFQNFYEKYVKWFLNCDTCSDFENFEKMYETEGVVKYPPYDEFKQIETCDLFVIALNLAKKISTEYKEEVT